MKLHLEPAGARHRLVYLAGLLALAVSALLIVAGRASADQIYWVNPDSSIAYSNLSDTAGGYLPASVFGIHGGSGAAIDTANGRIYVSQEATDQIAWFGLDGTTSGVVNTAPGSVDKPTNIAIDPETQTLYWANDESPGSIGYAFVDESGGGTLGHSGATVDQPTRLAVDMRHDRVYWWNEGTKEFSWAGMNGLGGGDLSTPGIGISEAGKMTGMAIEPYSSPEELYFVSLEPGAEGIFHTDPILGGAPEEIQGAFAETRSNVKGPTGLAFDLASNKFYWANSNVVEEPEKAIGTATVFGRPATIKVFPEAPIHNPVFAAILKEPEALAEPQLSASGSTLSCTLGEWEGDHPGASVYAAPTSFSYQWKRGSTAISGATGNSFTATESGSYVCEVVAENAAGSSSKTSKAASLTFPAKPKATTTTSTSKSSKSGTTAGSAKLASTKPVKVKAGGTAVVKVDLVNSGTTSLSSTKVCGALSKQAKKGLKAPACVTVKSVAAGKTVVATLKVKALASAHGTYKATVAVSGAVKASLTAKVQVAARKKR